MAWGVFGHSMWAPPHDQIWSCGVAPVGQLGMEGISAFYTPVSYFEIMANVKCKSEDSTVEPG